MDEVINHGRSKGIVVISDGSPVSEGPVGGHDDGATFIPVGDHLEEELKKNARKPYRRPVLIDQFPPSRLSEGLRGKCGGISYLVNSVRS